MAGAPGKEPVMNTDLLLSRGSGPCGAGWSVLGQPGTLREPGTAREPGPKTSPLFSTKLGLGPQEKEADGKQILQVGQG